MNSEPLFDNTDLTASNMSEISCGGSLCLSTKEQYKVINRNQLTKLDFPLFRAGTTSIECGMSLMEEISEIEDEYENPFESTQKRKKIKQLFEKIKDKSKKGYSSLRKSISKIGMKIKMKMGSEKTKDSKSNDDVYHKSISRLTSNCSNVGKTKASLSLSKIRLFNKTQILSTSRKAKIQRKVSQVSNKASYKLNTKCSYISKRFVSASSSIKSKIVYNCYKLRNMIGDKFPRRSSKFVLSFKKSSEDVEKKMMNCNHYQSNELIYDSIEYISRNADDIEEIHIVTNDIQSNLNIEESEGKDISVNNQNYNAEKEVSSEKSSINDSHSDNISNNSPNNDNHQIEIDLIKNEFSGLESNNEVDETTPTTTIDSFLRLSSMDSTCTTIHNDTNSNNSFPVIPSIGKAMERMESLYQEIIQLKNKNHTNPLKFEKEDMEIFDSMKEIVANLNTYKDEKETLKTNDSYEEINDESLNSSHTITKQKQPQYDLLLTLLRQTLQYYENIKNSYSESELKVKSSDNEHIKHLIINAIQKLNSSGVLHATKV
ncbi:uncharacterized protein cubi_01517 [Cryptosporidium ubiquitum]|uniref:Uncharacterized protein n=1 Tax=Cryptosporidium ubiquitum TaxID=857276 RepID=A0A1J4MD68_9CRYT|nr:uncharacterized protein cubi_01517 [Cryptosporidium ubiquitum]OII72184.1 hypothetical protein cubi_01517 [Cryptosporidium ubiquitum]